MQFLQLQISSTSHFLNFKFLKLQTTITIAIISFVKSAAIPSSANDLNISGQNVEENVLADISSDEDQVPDWMVEFNEYLYGDVLTFDFDAFMAKLSDDEIEAFIDFFTMVLDEELSEDDDSFQA